MNLTRKVIHYIGKEETLTKQFTVRLKEHVYNQMQECEIDWPKYLRGCIQNLIDSTKKQEYTIT